MNPKLLTLILLIFSPLVYSQIAVSYFPFQSVLSVSSNTDNLLWADYKVETNTFILNLNMELSPKINFIERERATYYAGPGISFNLANATADLPLTNGYFIDTGVRVKPIMKCREFQVVFEISPYVNRGFSSGNLRTRLGVSYTFGRKKAE